MKEKLKATSAIPKGTAPIKPAARLAPDKSDRRTLTIPEVGKALGVSRNAAYEAARRGEIPTIRIGKLLLVPKIAFDRMLENPAEKAS